MSTQSHTQSPYLDSTPTSPSDSIPVDVAVIGAGVAGSSLAATLSARGHRVLLLDKDRFPRHKVCGEFLSPEAQASLGALGVHAEVVQRHPVALTRATIASPRGATVEMTLPGAAWGLSRYALDEALLNAAQRLGAVAWTQITVSDIRKTAAGYTLTARRRGDAGPLSVQARTVIAACGRHGVAALPPQPRKIATRRLHVGVKAHYAGVSMPRTCELFLFRGGYVGVNAVESLDGQSRVNVCALVSYPAFATAGRSTKAVFEAAMSRHPALAERLRGGTLLPETVCAVAPVDTYRQAAPWGEGPNGVACVGDTASMIPPLCGDGMAMALRSVELCAPLADEFLRGELTREQWQSRYAAAWRDEFAPRLRTGRLLQRALGVPFVADGLIALGDRLPHLADHFVHATRGPLRPAASA